ncbi:CPBP family intramembrane metalloprotease [Limosilactobacillus fermentum]
MLLIHQAINAIGELVLALTIPFLWWLIVTRRQVRFDRWLGFFLPPVQRTWLTTVIVVLFTLLLAIPLPLIVDHGILATFIFNHRGFAGIPAALVYAIVGTSLPEEILFRGFLLKRLQDRFGFLPANLTQAICFGAVHGLLLAGAGNWLVTLIIVLIEMVIGYCLGWLNERRSGGSLYTSWGIHALLNTVSALIALFT